MRRADTYLDEHPQLELFSQEIPDVWLGSKYSVWVNESSSIPHYLLLVFSKNKKELKENLKTWKSELLEAWNFTKKAFLIKCWLLRRKIKSGCCCCLVGLSCEVVVYYTTFDSNLDRNAKYWRTISSYCSKNVKLKVWKTWTVNKYLVFNFTWQMQSFTKSGTLFCCYLSVFPSF